MGILSEEKLLSLLRDTLSLSQDLLAEIPERGTAPTNDTLRDQYHSLVNGLMNARDDEEKLSDQSWNWIWEHRSDATPIQLYGRAAWINLQLLDLL